MNVAEGLCHSVLLLLLLLVLCWICCWQGVLGFKEGFWSPDLALLAEASQAGVSFNISEVTLTATVDTGAVKFHKCQPGACIQSANGTLTCAARRTGPLCAICEVCVGVCGGVLACGGLGVCDSCFFLSVALCYPPYCP